ncbi:MAG: aminotransferase class III-fold pyridoxal phosphate-dependent enzyme [Acidobacteriota bacterium]
MNMTGLSSYLALARVRAAEQAQDLAYTFLQAGEESDRLTFGDLDQRARAIAARLQEQHSPGDRALLLYPPGLDYVAAFFGCLYAGVVAVPAYPPRMNRNLPRLQSIIEDAEPTVALTTGGIYSQLRNWFQEAPELKTMGWETTDVLDLGHAEDWREVAAQRDDLAFLQYTSGSTAKPKGVMVSHGNLLHNQALMAEGLRHHRDTVVVSWLPLYHDMGLIGNVLASIYNGVPCYLMAPVDFLKKPRRWLEAITRYGGTFSGAPDFGYALCVEKISPQEREGLDLSSWQSAFNGSEPVQAETLHRFSEAFEPVGFQRKCLYPCYGLAEYTLFASGRFKTERSVAFARDELENNRARPARTGEHSRTLVSCGVSPTGGRIAIVDPQTKRRCSEGETGEIWLASDSVAQGYWKRERATEETFRAFTEPDDVDPGGDGPFLRTGDLGFLYGGELYVTGRSKDLIIIRGRNLHPQDIEVSVEASHAALKPGFAAAFPVTVAGTEHLAVVAEVKREKRHHLDVEEVFEAIRRAVAAEHAVQVSTIALLRPGSLPKTSSGKTQRSRARLELAAGNLPTLGEWRDGAVFTSAEEEAEQPPREWSIDKLEGWFLQRVAERLKLDPARIDRGQPLASYGLESVVAASLSSDIEETLSIEFPVDELFLGEPRLSDLVHQMWRLLGDASPEDTGIIRLFAVDSPPQGPTIAPPPTSTAAARPTPPAGDEDWHPFRSHVNPEIGRLIAQLAMDKVYVRGEGCYLWDQDGHRYLDFLAQYGALPFGFNPPQIWAALEGVKERAEPNFVQPSNLEAAGELARRLVEAAPPGLQYVTFSNSGTEAVEAAIKLARSSTGRLGVLSTSNAFHGKTLGSLSATDKLKYQRPFGAPIAGFETVPYGDLEALRQALAGGRFAAFLVEPVQGEGGIIEPPAGYLREAQALCREVGTLLIADEVQTGLGRTGTLFACQREGITPDIMTLAKALGGGLMPIGACLSTAEVYDTEFGLNHSSTFAGNAMACRAALATLDLLEADDLALVRNVAETGERLKRGLVALQRRFPHLISEVRGRGYLLGIKFGLNRYSASGGLLGYIGERDVLTALVVSHLLNFERLRVGYSLNKGEVLRIEPPLTAGWEECERFLTGFENVLKRLDRQNLAAMTAHITGVDIGEAERLGMGQPANDEAVRQLPAERSGHRPGGRFAFIVHPLDISDYSDLDSSLGILSKEQLEHLSTCIGDNFDPFVIGETSILADSGRTAYGEFIIVPRSAEDLREMPPDEALEEVRLAVDVARQRGAKIVGLGAYTSVVTHSGLTLQGAGIPALTTGNSFTSAAARRLIKMSLDSRGRRLESSSVAVLGAGGAIGQAVSLLVAEEAQRLFLVGNPAHPEASLGRLYEVAGRLLGSLDRLAKEGRTFPPGSLADQVFELGISMPSSDERSALAKAGEAFVAQCDALVLSVDADRWVAEADVVVTATSTVEKLVKAELLKTDAIVCDISTPSNVGPEVKEQRPDVMVVDGGIVRLPGDSRLGFNASLKKGQAYACMAETMMLALEQRYEDMSLGFNLCIEKVIELEHLAKLHGFEVYLDPDDLVPSGSGQTVGAAS